MITQDFLPLKGGIASYLYSIWEKYLQKTDFRVIIPEYIVDDTVKNLPFQVISSSFKPFNIADFEREKCNTSLIQKIEDIAPDIILFGYLRSHTELGMRYKQINPKSRYGLIMHAKEAFLTNTLAGITHVQGAHKEYTTEEIHAYYAAIMNADYVFTVSDFTKNLLINQGLKREYITIYPSLKEASIIVKDKSIFELGLDSQDYVLLSVGRLIKRKGQDLVLNTLPKLKEHIPNLKYIIAGEGPEKYNLENQVKNLSLEQNVLFAGKVEDSELAKYYSSTNLFVLPCRFIPPNDVEGFGIVFLEANLYGKPVIAGNTGGATEAVQHNATGLLIDPEDKSELEEAILKVYHNPSLASELGMNGRLRVLEKYISTPSDKLLNLFTASK
ncbi:TPA: glycosyltransferase family 4 protein [Candidatus Woesearchaeota archaeon]|uniref:Glycosyltransferase, group 1 family protein n=1 Tax=Candidatus Falkowbacteria bacterium GW2011_GWA2_39_24 TaxID=1618634 RepID=A0A0G0QWD1_9BACT|nr:MAG: Glycosyltransferase, group 1 family protein [Candidatus Falkowbacteria bacterium GW2011_GWA2_39_24]HIH32176.1 glycosyltransferase family 4 protein [Candidatus Woesearchaeota archaeon]HIJ13723.1 glycosyltransferase family 4 protein [Candidatus Woesearchaeota archaeon]